MDDLRGVLDQVKARWMAGGAARDLAPEAWRGLLEGVAPDEAELRLAALIGQAEEAAFEPEAPKGLTPRPSLPRLPARILEGEGRQRFRRLFEAAKNDGDRRRAILRFLAGRGYAAHPADWAPTAREEDAPALYAPWIAWAAEQAPREEDDALTEESWDRFAPAERRLALLEIRRADPAAARELIAAKAASEPAERRLRLIEALEEGLSDADAPYLESLLKDRSPKTAALAKRLLARLGRAAADAEAAAELAEMLKLEKPMISLSGAKRLTLRKLKTDAQRRRRDELFREATAESLAAALETDAETLAKAWDFSANARMNDAFLTLVVGTAPPAAFAAAFASWLDAAGSASELALLTPRLGDAERRQAIERWLDRDETDFRAVADLLGASAGRLAVPDMAERRAFKALLQVFARDRDAAKAAAETRADNFAREQLISLGLLASAEIAPLLIERVAAAGVIAADPHFDMLRLNALTPPAAPPEA